MYRIESDDAEQYPKAAPTKHIRASSNRSPTDPSKSRKRKRCFSVHGLFALTSVCRQTRAETHQLVFERNSFAFSNANYNCGRALHAFTQSLMERQLSTVYMIYWPLTNALFYQRSLHGEKIEEPDQACVKEFRAMKGLKTVVLRYIGSDVSNTRDRVTEYEKAELQARFAERGGWDYWVEREFRRTLAVRGMRALIEREDVEVACEKTWRAAF